MRGRILREKIFSTLATPTMLARLTMLAMFAIPATASAQVPSPARDPAANFETLCGSCHPSSLALSSRRTRELWLQTVNAMVARGAQGTDAELLAVVDYLTREHGRVNVNLAAARDIADVLGVTTPEAETIVQYRRDKGTFDDLSALEKVPGIDVKKLDDRKEALIFGLKVASGIGRIPAAALITSNSWPGLNGGPQRDGWAKGEAMLSRETVRGVKLLYARKLDNKLDNKKRGLSALTPPVTIGNLVTHRGFRELIILGGSDDNVYAIDAALNTIYWSTHLPFAGAQPSLSTSSACSRGLMGVVTVGSAAASGRGGGAGGAIRRGGPGPGRGGRGGAARGGVPGVLPPTLEEQARLQRESQIGPGLGALAIQLAGGMGRSANSLVLAVGSDGNLHTLFQSNGADFAPPLKFLPAGSTVSGLNVNDYILYGATTGGCGGPNAIYAIDLHTDKPTTATFETNGSSASGTAGTTVGNDGTVFLQVASGRGDVAGEYHDTVLALTAKDLRVKDYFTPSAAVSGAPPRASNGSGIDPQQGVTPVAFQWKGKEVIAAASGDGRVYLLDSTALGGADHHTPLAQTSPIATSDPKQPGYGIRGAFASWEDPETGVRWIYAPLWGPPNAATNFQTTNGPAPNGAIAAFKLEDRDGRPAITLAWISGGMTAPAPPVVANGLIVALSSGEAWRLAGENVVERLSSPATLYLLDAATGKELFTSGKAVAAPSHDGGVAVANGSIYFGTQDNTVYSFGIPMEH